MNRHLHRSALFYMKIKLEPIFLKNQSSDMKEDDSTIGSKVTDFQTPSCRILYTRKENR